MRKRQRCCSGYDATNQAVNANIVIWSDELQVASSFKTLGCTSISDTTTDAEVTHKTAAANTAFVRLLKAKLVYRGIE